MEDDRFITGEEAAEMLGVSMTQLSELIATGKIPTRKFGKHVKLALSDVLAGRE